MRVILGIGNPGKKYQFNRHNAGFLFLDYFARKYNLTFKPSKFDFYAAPGSNGDNSFVLIKPSDYVNNSGVAAVAALRFYKAKPEDFLLFVDDLNLNTADFRVRAAGGDAGHNGTTSVIYHLNTDQFPRIRIGIGNNFERGRMAEYVLSDFSPEDMKLLEKTFEACSILTEDFITGGTKKMLDTNSRLLKQSKKEEGGLI